MALYQDGILISGANTLPKFTLAEYNALPADQRPTYWERTDGDYDDILAEKTDIATIESGTTASRAYSVGELVYVGGTLYRVKTAIASGATFTVGTNVEVTTVGDKFKELQANNGGTQVNIKSYTSSNPFITPSDGYVELNTANGGSENGIVRILGANNQLISISRADFPTISSVFVRKGMKVYTQSATTNMVISFAPII